MVKESQTFKKDLRTIKKVIADKKKFPELATRCGVTVRTAQAALSVNRFDELTNKSLTVYQEAIKMVEEINSLPSRANQIVKEINSED